MTQNTKNAISSLIFVIGMAGIIIIMGIITILSPHNTSRCDTNKLSTPDTCSLLYDSRELTGAESSIIISNGKSRMIVTRYYNITIK